MDEEYTIEAQFVSVIYLQSKLKTSSCLYISVPCNIHLFSEKNSFSDMIT